MCEQLDMNIPVAVVFDSVIPTNYYFSRVLGSLQMTQSIISWKCFLLPDGWINSEEQCPLLRRRDGSGAVTQREGKISHHFHLPFKVDVALECLFLSCLRCCVSVFWHRRRPAQRGPEEHGQCVWNGMSWLHPSRRRDFWPGESSVDSESTYREFLTPGPEIYSSAMPPSSGRFLYCSLNTFIACRKYFLL